MKWYVYFHDFNKNELIKWNIFNNWKFKEYVEELLRTKNDKNEFCEKLKNELMYFFWSKCQYEIVISSLDFGSKDTVSKKIDIYNQVMLNFDRFADYIWSFKEDSDE